MTSNRIFLFPIQTASLSFGFRLLEIQISPPLDGTFKAKLLNRVKSKFARRIWKSEKNKAAEKWSVLTKINKPTQPVKHQTPPGKHELKNKAADAVF